jgi:hypothetical protein
MPIMADKPYFRRDPAGFEWCADFSSPRRLNAIRGKSLIPQRQKYHSEAVVVCKWINPARHTIITNIVLLYSSAMEKVMRLIMFFAIIFAGMSAHVYANDCGDGLVMLGRTLPYAGLETNDRKIAHNMLRKAHNEYAQGNEQQCKLIAGEIVKTYVLKQPAQTPQPSRVTAELPSGVVSQVPESGLFAATVLKDEGQTKD